MEGVLQVTTMIASAMETITASSEEQSSAMEEIASSTVALHQMAEQLQTVVQRFVTSRG